MYKLLARSHSLRAGAVYAIGGTCFSVGNLLLARALSTEDFAAFALVLAVAQLATTLGPLGADTIINRYPVNPGRPLFLRIATTSAGVALLAGLLLWRVYDLAPGVSVMAAMLGIACSVNLVASAFFRSRGRFSIALAMTQGQNFVMLVAAVAAVLVVDATIVVPLGMVIAAYVATGFAGWYGAFGLERSSDAVAANSLPWREGRTIIATSLAIVILVQIERLSIPKLLDTEALATFAVLAAIAGSAFRVLQLGVGYTLVPRLRNAESRRDVLRIIRSEARTACLLTAVASTAIGFLGRPVATWITGGKYELGAWMLVAAISGGLAKVVASFGSAGVTALGSHGDLARLRNGAWLSAAVASAGAMVGANFGLVGLLFGVVCGWVIHASRTVALAWPIVNRYEPST